MIENHWSLGFDSVTNMTVTSDASSTFTFVFNIYMCTARMDVKLRWGRGAEIDRKLVENVFRLKICVHFHIKR